jgi:hypothetical protein
MAHSKLEAQKRQARGQAKHKKPIGNGKQGQSVHEDLWREEIVKDRDWKVSRVMIYTRRI